MLVSGGQILAIDHVVRNDTLVGDGSTTPLGVNTDVIATTALVSATSAKLQEEIDTVSGKFNDYYKKNETSAASEISAALKYLHDHEPVVSAGKNIKVTPIDVDGTIHYVVSAMDIVPAVNISGRNGIDVVNENNTTWISYTGTDGVIYSAGKNIDIYQQNGKWYISATVPDVSNFLTSAVGHEGKALVLKDNVWVPADEANGDIVTINTYSSVSSFVDAHSGDIINTVNTYSSYSSFYNNTVDVVSSYSAYWNEVSSFSSHSGEFMHPSKLEYAPGTTTITGYDGSAFGDKDTNYVGIDGIKVDKDTFEIGISANFLSASDKYLSANALDDLSGKWESVYDTVDTNSAAWNAHSALSATKLDASESAKFMKIADLQSAPENTISGYGESAFYYPPFPEIPEYSGKDGIKVENYEISISADYLSANALDELSGKWEDTANTVSTASGGWNEASAFGANSGKFVTSAGVEFEDNLAYFLKKQEDESMAWSGVDLSDLGKIYPISSLTPDLVSATVSSVDGTLTYMLSAAKPEEVTLPGIVGQGCDAKYISQGNNKRYSVAVALSGQNGISAAFDDDTKQWNIGISANDYSYLAGLYDKAAALSEGDIIKYDSNNTQHIEIDKDGYFTLPDTGNKFTFCINESIENNTTTSHDYKLNKIALIKVNTQTNAEEVIVTTHNYYPSEVGASDANITFTLSHLPNYKYAVKYLGSDIPVTANLVSKISIIEEITSLATTEGGGRTYGGVEPVWVDNDANLVGLAYDRTQFKTVTGVDEAHPELSALQIDIHTTGGNIDQEAFEKMANLIYSRMTETIPFGALNNEASLAGAHQYAYLFRPPMEYDMTSATQAYMFGGNGDGYISVAVYEGKSSNSNLIWQSNYTQLPGANGGEVVMDYLNNAPTGTITPNSLYYVAVRIHKLDGGDGSWSYVLGTLLHEHTTSVGQLVPWCGVGGISTLDFPATYSFNGNSMDEFGAHKPYVGFRTK